MTIFHRLGQSLLDAIAIVVVFVIGVLLASALFLFHLLPKWKKEEAEAAAARLERMRESIEKARSDRHADAEREKAAVAAARAAEPGDTIELANQIITDAERSKP